MTLLYTHTQTHTLSSCSMQTLSPAVFLIYQHQVQEVAHAVLVVHVFVGG